MPSVQIKDVPPETHAVLRRQAAEAHQSLQEYLRCWLIEQAATPTVAEVLQRAGDAREARCRCRPPLTWSERIVIVIDASVLSVALVDDGQDGDVARARLSGEVLTAPEIVDLEVLSVLRKLVAGGDLPSRRAARALEDLSDFPMTRAPHLPLLERCWALRDDVTPYDAAYVALAEMLGCPLVTADLRLSRAPGLDCAVEVVTSGGAA